MYRLAQLNKQQRSRLGWAMLAAGTVLMIVSVWWVHYAGFPPIEVVDGVERPLVVDYFNWVPRGWFWKVLGYIGAFVASQLLIAGAYIGFVLGEKMTWSRATFAAWLAWFELVLIFGIVPSEWLNLSQTDLDWSNQRVAVTIPSWLVLGNQVDISWAAVKDSISGIYHLVMLGAAAVFVYQFPNLFKPPPAGAEKAPKLSPYGRPLVKENE
jgi:hypothetical protein